MSIKLTQKERMLLEDQRSHEDVCIKKYNNYANMAQDQQLKQLFNTYSSQEQQHYNTLTQMLGGNVPDVSGNQGQQNMSGQNAGQGQMAAQGAMRNEGDAVLCNDMLMTEKYVSGAYDTAIFEFADANARQALNHIQKEEQQHGEGIFNYMKSKGMYNMQ